MSNHQKRLSAPTAWAIERKTETFTISAGAGPHGEAGVPLLIVLRDVLGYVDNRKEARYALSSGRVLVNGTTATDEERPIGMFDILAFVEREEYYRVFPDEGGRLALTPIDADAADSKLGKIDGKSQLPGNQTQLQLHDGATLLVDDPETYRPGDSIVIDNEDGSIVAHFVYEEGALVTAIGGSHAGEIGELEEIRVTPGSSNNVVLVSPLDGGDAFETIEDYVVVIDENFVDGDEDAETASESADSTDEEDDGGDDE